MEHAIFRKTFSSKEFWCQFLWILNKHSHIFFTFFFEQKLFHLSHNFCRRSSTIITLVDLRCVTWITVVLAFPVHAYAHVVKHTIILTDRFVWGKRWDVYIYFLFRIVVFSLEKNKIKIFHTEQQIAINWFSVKRFYFFFGRCCCLVWILVVAFQVNAIST